MTDSYSYEQRIGLQYLCASETVEIFAFCHHTNGDWWCCFGLVLLTHVEWWVSVTPLSLLCVSRTVCSRGEACCSQTDLHALVLMLSWAEENVCSVWDSSSFCGWLGNLEVLIVPCTFYPKRLLNSFK